MCLEGSFKVGDVQQFVPHFSEIAIHNELVRLKAIGNVASFAEQRWWSVIPTDRRSSVQNVLAEVDRDIYEKYCTFKAPAYRSRRRDRVRKFSKAVRRMADRALSLNLRVDTVVSDEHGVEGHIFRRDEPRTSIYKSATVEGLWGFLYGYGYESNAKK